MLTVGADNPAYPPWFGGDEKKPWKVSNPYSGKGYESAVVYAIAAQLGLAKSAVEWTYVPFNNSYKPGKKPFDFYVTQVSYSPERAKAVDFSRGYYFVNQAVVGAQGHADREGEDDRRSQEVQARRAGRHDELHVHHASHQAELGRRSCTTTNDAAIQALKNGQIDGIVVDLPTAFYVVGGRSSTTASSSASCRRRARRSASGSSSRRATRSGLRRPRDREPVGERDDQEARQDLARQRRRARPEVATGDRSSRILGGATVRVSKEARTVAIAVVVDHRLRRLLVVAITQRARLARVQGVLLRLGHLPRLVPRDRSTAFWLNVKLFLIAEVLILPVALLLAVLRSLPGPVFFPMRALAIVYADLFRGIPTILVIMMLGFGMPALGVSGVPISSVLLGGRRARARLHGVRLGGVPRRDRVGAPEPGGGRALARALAAGRRCVTWSCRRQCAA